MSQEASERIRIARPLLLCAVLAAAATMLIALTFDDISRTGHLPIMPILAFSAFLVVVSNFSADLGQYVAVTPDLMVVMVAVAALHSHDGVFSAAVVGFSGGLVWDVFTNPARRLRENVGIVAFNCAQLSLAGGAAGLAYAAIPEDSIAWFLAAAACAAVAYAVVNVSLVCALVCANGTPRRVAWSSMAPELPNFFAFGVVGALVGQLYSLLGVLSLVLLIVPSIIARRTYRSSLDLREAREQTIAVFMRALEVKDTYTARHTERVAKYACYIGEQLGYRGNHLDHLRHAALMHDIGKLAVSSDLLNKPGRLTETEYAEIKRHNEVGVEILSRVQFLRPAIPVATDRHGFFDASSARADPEALVGYIVAVADAFDAMTSTRAYRRALLQEVAFDELQRGAATQFHPACVQALISAIRTRGETFGAGHEQDVVAFAVEPPAAGVGSACLGDLEQPRPDASETHPAGSASALRFSES